MDISKRRLHLLLFSIVIFPVILLLYTMLSSQAHAQTHDEQTTYYKQQLYGGDKTDYVVDIDYMSDGDLTNVKYIENANYYIVNPQHAKQKPEYNYEGTCTTVAFQMMLGYHNYYSDRRIIPKFNKNNNRYLNDNYGNILENPKINDELCYDVDKDKETEKIIQHGRASIGTEVGIYDDIYNLTMFGYIPGLGQSIDKVTTATREFLDIYSDYGKDITFHTNTYDETQAKHQIDINNPIIIGRSKLNESNDYHVLNAYGYAHYKGEFGYIVHYGWGVKHSHAWIPASRIGYQSYCRIKHQHNMVDTGKIVANAYREYVCTTCGYNTPVDIYETSEDGSTITKVKYPIDGNITIPKFINDKRIDKIGAGVFANTNITSVNLGYVQEIGDGAFENCKSLTNLTSYDYLISIGNSAFKGCDSLRSIHLSAKVTGIGERAFEGCNSLDITAYNGLNFFAQNNILYNYNRTEILHTGHIPQSLIIPDTVEKVAPYAFAGNVNLEAIRFNGNTLLGDHAFADCDNLKYVYFDTFTPPSFGDSVFANNYPTVYVPYNAQADYKAALPSLANFIQSIQFTVHFISDGQAIASHSVYNGSTIENLPSVDIKGYEFGGWYGNPSYTGDPFANGQIWQSESDINLYAKLTPIQYTVTLDAAGGVLIGNDKFQVTFDGAFNTAASATRTGHGLEGWYDENDVKYLTADGACTRTWDKANNATLFAKWYVESYEIQIADERNVVWLSNSGLSDNPCYIQYGTVINTINLIKVFKNSAQGFREGKIFDCFSFNNAQLDWTTVPDLGDDKSIVTIYPIWVNEVHTIYFNALCQIDVPKVEAEYDATIDLPNTARTGYILNGWYTAQSGGQKVNWVRMPDLTPDAQNNGSVMLYARWSPITYTVKYDLNGYSGTLASTSHTYDVNLALRYYSPNRTGYNFKGWSTTRNGEVNFSNAENVANLTSVNGATVTLYAVWSPISYFFNFKNLIDGMFGSITYYTYGEGLAVMPTLRMRPASFAPSYEYPNFYGWYTTSAFTTQITSVSKTQTGAITLYAKYDYMLATESHENTYTVTDDGGTKNPNFQIAVNLKSYHYNIVKNTTLKTIRFEISFDMWKVDDGYQHIYLRNDDVDTTGKSPMEIISESLVLSQKLDISSGTHHKSYTVTLDLEKFKNSNSFTLLFDASGAFSDTWKFNNLNIKAYLTN